MKNRILQIKRALNAVLFVLLMVTGTTKGNASVRSNFIMDENISSTFSVEATPYPIEGGVVTGAGVYNYGETCTLTATANEGYTFAYWRWNSSQSQLSTNAIYSFIVQSDRDLVAVFTLPFSISATTNHPEGCMVLGEGTYNYGDTCTLTAIGNEGYSFVCWKENGTQVSTNATYSFTVNSDRDLVAIFSPITISTTTNMAEGGVIAGMGVYNHGDTCTLIATANEGYTFMYWTENDILVCADATYSFIVDNDRDLVANFAEEDSSCTIIFNLFDSYGDGWNNNYLVVNYGNSVHEQFTIESGNQMTYSRNVTDGSHISLSWVYGTYTQECSFTISNANGDVIYHGANTSYFTGSFDFNCVGMPVVTYNITAIANHAESGIIMGAGTYNCGDTCTLTATANEGYTFMYWRENGAQVSTDATYSFAVSHNRNLMAVFSPFTITAIANYTESGMITGTGIYNYGDTCTLTAIPVEGYSFGYWTENGTEISTDSIYTFIVDDDRDLVANFVEENSSCTINFNLFDSYGDGWNGNYLVVNYGNGIHEQFTIQSGNYATYSREVVDGSRISLSWIYGSYIQECSYTISYANGDVIYHGVNTNNFTGAFDFDCVGMSVVAYNITTNVNPSTGGTVTGSSMYNCGTTCTLTATANEGYNFAYWMENDVQVSTDATYSFTVYGDRNLIAVFSPFTITAIANHLGSGTTTGSGMYNYGDICTLNATANDGYIFRYWTESGSWVSNNPTYSFTVSYHRNLVANFSPFTITAIANLTEGGVVTGSGVYDNGSDCTLSAVPNEGFEFMNWTKNGEVVSCDANYSFTVTGDADYEAVFMHIDENIIGEGEATNLYLPSYSYYKYSLSQQIYTSDEMGESRNITKLSFFNSGDEKTRSYAIYMIHTDKESFENNIDWITVESKDCVFNGYVTMKSGYWTTISFNKPFVYDGVSNVVLVVDDNSGNYTNSPHMQCRVYETEAIQAIRVYNDNLDYNPTNPTAYTGTLHSVKNQIIFNMPDSYIITATANRVEAGLVSGTGLFESGSICTLTATTKENYTFFNWTENDEIVSTTNPYEFEVTADRNLVANFGVQTNHWTPSENYQNSMFMIGVVTIDGVEQTSPVLELGAFCNGECRGSEFPFEEEGRWLYFMSIGGNTGDDITFRLYDHALQQELDLFCYNVLPFVESDFIGLDNPYEVLFASSFIVSADVNPEGTGTVSGAGEYAYGATATLTATANEGYAFSSWTLDGEIVSTEPSYTFTVNGPVHLTANFDVVQVQQLTLGWNWFSTYLEITLDDLKAALVEALPDATNIVIQSKTQATTYNGSRWRGQLNTLDVACMYKITVPVGCEITLAGMPIDPAEHPITIPAGQIVWIGFPFRESMTPADAFAGFAVNGDMVSSKTQSSAYYGTKWRGQLSILVPGQGYIYKSNAQGDRTFIFPISTK